MNARILEPSPHEFGGNLIFTEHDLSPYFALDRQVKNGNGSARATVRHEDETYDVTLSYQQSGLKPRDDPDFRLETVLEFRITVSARDEVGERKASYHVAPRWPNMESKGDGPDPSSPNFVGVNVRAQGSNLSLGAYPVHSVRRRTHSTMSIFAVYLIDVGAVLENDQVLGQRPAVASVDFVFERACG